MVLGKCNYANAVKVKVIVQQMLNFVCVIGRYPAVSSSIVIEGASLVTSCVQLRSIVVCYCSSMAFAPRANHVYRECRHHDTQPYHRQRSNHAKNREAGKAYCEAQAKPMVRPTTLVAAAMSQPASTIVCSSLQHILLGPSPRR